MVYFSGSRPFLSGTTYCPTFRTPTTQYCIMILARRGHQTALVQYVETYKRNSGSRKRNPCVRKIFELMFSAWKRHFHVELAMILPSAHGFSMGSAWILKLSTGDRRCDIRISPTFWNHAESMRVQKKRFLKSPIETWTLRAYKRFLLPTTLEYYSMIHLESPAKRMESW